MKAYNLLQMSKFIAFKPVLRDYNQDVELQLPAKVITTDEVPLYPASTWLKHQFKRAISPEERGFLFSRTLKYLIVQRAALNQDMILLMSIGPFVTNPPDIEGINAPQFFKALFIIKLISGLIYMLCFQMLFREKKQAGIARVVSIEMLDYLKLSNVWLVISGVLMLMNTILDFVALSVLRCSATECSHVTSSDPDGNKVLQFQYSIVINLLLFLFFPFIYWKILVQLYFVNKFLK